jgi:hypothetical protein
VQNQKIIILNGRKYDALTGKPIGGSLSDIVTPEKSEPTRQIFSPNNSSKPRFIDDFAPKLNHIPAKPPVKASEFTEHPQHHAHQHAENIKRELAKSKTLMRKPLKKPILGGPSIIHPTKKTNYMSRGNPVLNRSNYTDSFRHSIINRTQEIKQHAAEAITSIAAAPPITAANIHERNMRKIESTSEDQLFQQAATTAVSETTKSKKKKKKKFFRARNLYIMSGVVLFLAILATSGWYFKYNLELDYANLKTGMHGSFPTYLPLGYKLDKFSYSKSSGTPSINFQYHPSDGLLPDNLYISETSSTLDNGGLVQTDIGPVSGEKYSTLSVNGLSVYHYNNQYAWLNAGILYILTNQTGLTQPTVLKIINSI